MNEGLEALERLKKGKASNSDITLIKKKVKQKEKLESDYELLKKQYDELLFTANDLNNENIELLRHKKVLEIIKKKKVNLRAFYFYDNLYEYNEYVKMANELPFQTAHELTQEEYDSLKKGLL